MKRGRPSIRHIVQPIILEVLQSNIFMNINTICKKVSIKTRRRISWNTIRKYLEELVELGKVEVVVLPHSKIEGKKGLTVYTIKK